MKTLTLLIFLASYAGVAFGALPRLAVDRTGFALLGAIALVVTGAVPLADALRAIDAPTILLLYALMVVSAQFRASGFYTWTLLQITPQMDRPRRFLLLLMLVGGGFAAILTNDIVCLAFTPVLVASLLRAGLNPAPYLLALAIASNIGSAATLIGNPQNILIGQAEQLRFAPFLLWCLPPALASLAAAYALILWNYRGRLRSPHPPATATAAATAATGGGGECPEGWADPNPHQMTKAVAVSVILLALFFTPAPREVTALAAAGFLLCSRRMASRSLLGGVDWHLISLFCGLFVIIHGLERTGLPAQAVRALAGHGVNLGNLHLLSAVTLLLSNLVSNVPAVMLLLKALPAPTPVHGYVLALASTFAGNLITIGSIANLIVLEGARRHGVAIGFREYARTGVPVTLASLLLLTLWTLAVAPK
ncbi:MAG: SLC13 family permease [Lentisphaeria bacterium]